MGRRIASEYVTVVSSFMHRHHVYGRIDVALIARKLQPVSISKSSSH